jgi:hypothetical protein
MGSDLPHAGNDKNGENRAGTRVECPRCSRVLEFTGARPLFCAFCGKPLPGTIEESTVVPAHGPDAPTITPDAASVPLIIEQPKTVGGYRLLRRLGGGGMGTVYEAEDLSGRHVALKLVGGSEPGSIDTLERFRREGRLASAISHPRCVFVLAADEDAGRPYIVMELMPGRTLADLVRENGPLPPAEAVEKTLDVLEGLREAHRHGVVHRDVKPSNCFLEADGRVKVGDFGLSKSLAGDSRLTVSGSFLGTPLYASPEQVRGEALGPQSDVYSLAATLYCLLTGRAPFEGGDAASTLARIASDPAPSMLLFRPELPPALDRVVLHALERDRRRRTRDLDEFREELRPFVPAQQEPAGRGARFAAFLVDFILLKLAGFLFFLVVLASGQFLIDTDPAAVHRQTVRQFILRTVLWSLYFVLSEKLWGCSLGKWLLHLRVCVVPGSERPGWRRLLARFAIFYVLMSLQEFLVIPLTSNLDYLSPKDQQQIRRVSMTLEPTSIVGFLLLLSTMRRRNGWRGLHEFASGTRVIQLPERSHQGVSRRSVSERLILSEGLPKVVGPFTVEGALRWDDGGRVLVGEDAGLGRRVLLWLRPRDDAPLSAARRACSRTTRLRWLASGQHDDWQWDAFPAPSGGLLGDLVSASAPLAWSEAQPVLEQLADELVASQGEGTLPDDLSIGQVWLQPDGSALLLDESLRESEAAPVVDRDSPGLVLLARIARLALEGTESSQGPVKAVMPEYAKTLVDRLCGAGEAFQDAEEVRDALQGASGRPGVVTASRRAAQVVLQAGAVTPGWSMMLIGAWLGGLMTLIALRETPAQLSEVTKMIQLASASEVVGMAASPGVLSRAAAACRYEMDAEFCARVKTELDKGSQLLNRRLQTANWLERSAYYTSTEFIDTRKAARKELKVQPTDPRFMEEEAALWKSLPLESWTGQMPEQVNAESVVESFDEALRFAVLVALAVWPALWVLSAFIFRGGLALRIMEVSLVRRDGRRAGRFRCALRSILVWAPPTLLLFVAVLLDGWYWSTAQTGSGHVWANWLAEGLRWTCLLLLATYPVLAIRSPVRGLQDRLAGTYLVPR